MALSDLIIRQAKAAEKPYPLPDTDGLGLVVSPAGGKSWHFRYYWLGKQKRISLGGYPEVSLREARALRDEARALLAKGINPHTDRKQKRRAARLASENTFGAVFLLWYEHRKKELGEIGEDLGEGEKRRQSTLAQIKRIFGKDVLPTLGKIPIYDIKRALLLEVVAKIEKRKAYTMAEKVRTWLRQLFRYAIVLIDGLEVNPASDLDVVAEPSPPPENNPFLRLPELPTFLRRLRGYRGQTQTQLAIRLLFLTGVRTGELRLATPEQFDLERGLWIIPPQNVKQLLHEMRQKKKRPQDILPYIVPLPVQAIEIVRYLLEQVKPAQRYLLAHRGDLKKRISENTLNNALKRMGYDDLLTGHGIRGTISTALNEIGYLKMWVEAQLSHADPNKARAAYNHATHVEPRRRMMQDWADRLDMLEQGELQAASAHLTIHLEGVPTVIDTVGDSVVEHAVGDIDPVSAVPIVVTASGGNGQSFQRLSPLPPLPEAVAEPEISDIQRERQEMLAAYEDLSMLPVPVFGKLAGKSKDQINREIKAGKLLALSMGYRGQRVPDWQLVPLKGKLVQAVLKQAPDCEPWQLYWLLTQPHPRLDDQAPIEAVTASTLHAVTQLVVASLLMSYYG